MAASPISSWKAPASLGQRITNDSIACRLEHAVHVREGARARVGTRRRGRTLEACTRLQARLEHLRVVRHAAGHALAEHERHDAVELLAQPVAARARDGGDGLDVGAAELGLEPVGLHLLEEQ